MGNNGKPLNVGVSFLFLLTFGQTQNALGAANSSVRTLTTCGAYNESDKLFAATDFEVETSSGPGAIERKLPQKSTFEAFPYKEARVVGFPEARFRIVTEIYEQTHANRRAGVLMAIYEEQPPELILRTGTSLSAEALAAGFRYSYEIPKTRKRISCITQLARSAEPKVKSQRKSSSP